MEQSSAPVCETPRDDQNVLSFDIDGYQVLVGRNNVSNERMVADHKGRHPDCLWLHALGASGSHVICCLEGKGQVPYDTFKSVGKLAIEYSRSRGTAVRFAPLTKVFKPDGAPSGIWQARPYRTFDI